MSIIPHTNTSIFPHSTLDNDLKIISFLGNRDQVRFSILNHRTYEVLNNDPFFKDIFEKYTAPCCIEYLSTYYPKNCWKVGCFYMDLQNKPLHFNESLLREPITQFFPAQPAIIKRKIEEICGTRYEDPSSPIHLAWLSYQTWLSYWTSCEKSEEMFKKLEYATSILLQYARQYENFNCSTTGQTPETFKTMIEIIATDENFKEALMKIDEGLGSSEAPELIRASIMAAKEQGLEQPFQQYIEAIKGFCRLYEYEILENIRLNLQTDLNDVESTLKILADPSKGEAASKNFEKINRSRLEMIFSVYYLNQCSLQIQSVLDQPIEGADPRLQKIQTLINSCSPDIATHVWGALYHSAANRGTENCWSELHFHEHLPALKSGIELMQSEWGVFFKSNRMKVFPNLENPNSIPP